jgi:hypothetical protein
MSFEPANITAGSLLKCVAESVPGGVPHFVFHDDIFNDIASNNVFAGELMHINTANIVNSIDGIM